MRKMQIIMAVVLCATLYMGVDARAASSFEEDFTGLSALPVNMEAGTGYDGSATFSNAMFTVGGGNVTWNEEDKRQFVKTTEQDYVGTDFTFEGTVTVDADTAFDSIFFGMGEGDVSGWMPSGNSLASAIDPRTIGGADEGFVGVVNSAFQEENISGIGAGTHRLRMEFDASTLGALFSINTNYTGGAFTADYALAPIFHEGFQYDLVPVGQLFFGGGSGCVFDDISVVTNGGSWSEDFTGLSALPANMEAGTGYDGSAYFSNAMFAVSGGNVTWNEENKRQYVRTTAETDYSTVDFTFEGTVTVDASTAFDSIFLGMGNGDSDTWMPAGNSLASAIDPRTGVDNEGFVGVVGGSFQEENISGIGAGTHRLRMVWDASAKEAVFSIDTDYAGGAFTADHTLGTLSHSPPTSSLFFGGGSGCSFDEISVTNQISAPIEPPVPPSTESWSEDFDGLSALPSNMEEGTGEGTVAISVGSDQVNWAETDGRQFVTTTTTNYCIYDFIFEATVAINGTGPFDTMFMGMGQGNVSGWMPTGVSLALAIDPRSGEGGKVAVNATFQPVFAGGLGAGTYRLQMAWDSATEIATFGIMTNYAGGAFSADHSTAKANASFTATSEARLFFGGGSGVVFDDVSYVDLNWEDIAEPVIVSLTSVGGGIMKMVVNAPSDADRYHPVAETDLVAAGPWTNRVAHSYTNTLGSMETTNLSYSAAEGTNEVIYVDGSAAAKFFKIIGE